MRIESINFISTCIYTIPSAPIDTAELFNRHCIWGIAFNAQNIGNRSLEAYLFRTGSSGIPGKPRFRATLGWDLPRVYKSVKMCALLLFFSLLVKGIEKLLLGKSLHCYQHGFLIAWCQAGETARLHECVVSFSIPIDYFGFHSSYIDFLFRVLSQCFFTCHLRPRWIGIIPHLSHFH